MADGATHEEAIAKSEIGFENIKQIGALVETRGRVIATEALLWRFPPLKGH